MSHPSTPAAAPHDPAAPGIDPATGPVPLTTGPLPVATAPTPPAAQRLSRESVSVIATLIVSAFVVILNETAMNVALRRIMDELRVPESLAQWLTTAFMLTMAVVIPVTGWLLQRLTTRTVFLLAMSLFCAGTAIAATAAGFEVLLAARVVQATGTAVMMPLLMTTIMTLVPASMRGRIMGNVSIVMAVAPAVGPSVSGLILSFANWRFVFAFVLPIAVTMLVVGALRMRNIGERREARLDALSLVLAPLGFGGTVYGLSLLGVAGATGLQLGIALGAGLAALALFVWRQVHLQRRDAALLDLRTLRHPSFTIALVVLSLAMMTLFGVMIILPLLLQSAYGLEPLQVGLMLLPGGLMMGLLGPVVGRLFDRVGARPLVVPGALAVGAVFVLLATITPATPWWVVMCAHVLLSVGLAFMFTPLFSVGLGDLPPRLYPHGSALIGTSQQLAGAAGTALFVSVMVVFGASAAEGVAVDPALFVQGARAAFITAGGVWLVAIVVACFTRTPSAPEAGHGERGPATADAPATSRGDAPAHPVP